MQNEPSFLQQFMQRRVMRTLSMYLIASFVLLQVGDMTFEPLGLPEWSMTVLILGLVIGLPTVGLLAWVFDLTPKGIVKTELSDLAEQSIGPARKLEFGLIALLSVALSYFVVQEVRRDASAVQVDLAGVVERSVAVVQFRSIGEASNYLADGLTTELANVLAAIPDLRVTSANSATNASGLGDDAAIGAALNVAHLVKGSVQKAGQMFRINVQLVRVLDGKLLWSYQTDKAANDIFSLQETIAENVAASLKSTLYLESLRKIARSGTNSPEAYEAYLLALHFRTDDWSSVIEHAERAVSIDPDFVAAHLQLAEVYAQRVGGTLPATESHPRARRALDTVLTVTPENPRALLIQGHLERLDRNFEKAEAAYRQAKILLPNQSTRHLANLLLFQGRLDEALAEYERTSQRHPSEPGFYSSALFAKGRYEDAIALHRSVFETGSERWQSVAYVQLASWYAFLGKTELAEKNVNLALVNVDQDFHLARGMLAYALARIGREDEALVIIKELEATGAGQYISPSAFFWAYLGARDLDRTFIALNRAIDERVYVVTALLQTSPLVDELRKDLRFVSALDRLGLADPI